MAIAGARGSLSRLLAGLTVRGRCLLSAGVAATLPGLALHEVNVTRVGVFLLALPVVSYVMYVLVALTWLVPDKRIERELQGEHAR